MLVKKVLWNEARQTFEDRLGNVLEVKGLQESVDYSDATDAMNASPYGNPSLQMVTIRSLAGSIPIEYSVAEKTDKDQTGRKVDIYKFEISANNKKRYGALVGRLSEEVFAPVKKADGKAKIETPFWVKTMVLGRNRQLLRAAYPQASIPDTALIELPWEAEYMTPEELRKVLAPLPVLERIAQGKPAYVFDGFVDIYQENSLRVALAQSICRLPADATDYMETVVQKLAQGSITTRPSLVMFPETMDIYAKTNDYLRAAMQNVDTGKENVTIEQRIQRLDDLARRTGIAIGYPVTPEHRRVEYRISLPDGSSRLFHKDPGFAVEESRTVEINGIKFVLMICSECVMFNAFYGHQWPGALRLAKQIQQADAIVAVANVYEQHIKNHFMVLDHLFDLPVAFVNVVSPEEADGCSALVVKGEDKQALSAETKEGVLLVTLEKKITPPMARVPPAAVSTGDSISGVSSMDTPDRSGKEKKDPTRRLPEAFRPVEWRGIYDNEIKDIVTREVTSLDWSKVTEVPEELWELMARGLEETGDSQAAAKLRWMGRAGLLKGAPLRSCLATSAIKDGQEVILVSTYYSAYSTALETALSLGHEICALATHGKEFDLTDEENSQREDILRRWFVSTDQKQKIIDSVVLIISRYYFEAANVQLDAWETQGQCIERSVRRVESYLPENAQRALTGTLNALQYKEKASILDVVKLLADQRRSFATAEVKDERLMESLPVIASEVRNADDFMRFFNMESHFSHLFWSYQVFMEYDGYCRDYGTPIGYSIRGKVIEGTIYDVITKIVPDPEKRIKVMRALADNFAKGSEGLKTVSSTAEMETYIGGLARNMDEDEANILLLESRFGG